MLLHVQCHINQFFIFTCKIRKPVRPLVPVHCQIGTNQSVHVKNRLVPSKTYEASICSRQKHRTMLQQPDASAKEALSAGEASAASSVSTRLVQNWPPTRLVRTGHPVQNGSLNLAYMSRSLYLCALPFDTSETQESLLFTQLTIDADFSKTLSTNLFLIAIPLQHHHRSIHMPPFLAFCKKGSNFMPSSHHPQTLTFAAIGTLTNHLQSHINDPVPATSSLQRCHHPKSQILSCSPLFCKNPQQLASIQLAYLRHPPCARYPHKFPLMLSYLCAFSSRNQQC